MAWPQDVLANRVGEVVAYLVGAGIVGLVVLALVVWDLRRWVKTHDTEIGKLRDFRHDLENEGLGEHFRRKFGRPETD